MTKSIAPPSRYWAVQKDGTTVQRHETVADRLGCISYVIPESCDTAQMSESALSQTPAETSVLTDHEKGVLGLPADRRRHLRTR
jgi:hypothetical protein